MQVLLEGVKGAKKTMAELEHLNQHLTTFKTGLESTADGLREVAHRTTDQLLPLLDRGIKILDSGPFGMSTISC